VLSNLKVDSGFGSCNRLKRCERSVRLGLELLEGAKLSKPQSAEVFAIVVEGEPSTVRVVGPRDALRHVEQRLGMSMLESDFAFLRGLSRLRWWRYWRCRIASPEDSSRLRVRICCIIQWG
jgi:hypothetical protein